MSFSTNWNVLAVLKCSRFLLVLRCRIGCGLMALGSCSSNKLAFSFSLFLVGALGRPFFKRSFGFGWVFAIYPCFSKPSTSDVVEMRLLLTCCVHFREVC
jgi:hypothetical protein